jgi:hypothetical protein
MSATLFATLLTASGAARARDEATYAFTRPLTVSMRYRHVHNPIWTEFFCAEGNNHVIIGNDTYFLSGDRQLMPTRKDQPPPDLRDFKSD